MITLPKLIARYPAMAELPQDRFDVLASDSVLIMGNAESRWLGFYEPAQAALIAHSAVISGALDEDGDDSAIPNSPVVRTDVDDVQVEFAGKIWEKVPYQEADLYSTSYGQTYVRWRRMAFAGPRIA